MAEHEEFIWFDGATVAALCAQLTPASRLEVRGHGEHMTLTVVTPGAADTAATSGPLNEAHICPPICP